MVLQSTPPCLLVVSGRGNEPRDYRFYNTWTEELEFYNIVEVAWNISVQGTPMYIFVTRLKNVKVKLTAWKRSKFSNFSDQVVTVKARMDATQRAVQASPLCQTAITNEKEESMRKQ